MSGVLDSLRRLHGKIHDRLNAKSDFNNMYHYDGVTKKVDLTGKYVNNDEVAGGAASVSDVNDENYQKQIMKKIL